MRPRVLVWRPYDGVFTEFVRRCCFKPRLAVNQTVVVR